MKKVGLTEILAKTVAGVAEDGEEIFGGGR
jgi:hypothetical protein